MNELIPEWAEKESDGNYLEVGAQLCTKDGRKCGNAFVNSLLQHSELGMVAEVVTDSGNKFKLTEAELKELFHVPVYVMKIENARAKFGGV